MFNANAAKEKGNILFKRGQYQEALQEYEAAISAEPTLAAAWFNKGLMHKKLQQYEEASLAFERVLAIDASHLKAKLNQADILLIQGKYQAAELLFTSVLQVDANRIESRLGKFICAQHISAKVIFACVDLKLTQEGTIKILEFANGVQSGFKGLQQATGNNVLMLLKEKAEQLSLPPLMLNKSLNHEASVNAIFDEELNSLPSFKGEFRVESLASYCAIYGGFPLKPVANKSILLMDDNVSDIIFEDKKYTHQIFMETDQLIFRPTTLILKREFTENLTSKTRESMPNVKRFVLKTPDQEGGKGVIIVEDDELDITLKCLLMLSENRVNADDINATNVTRRIFKRYADHFRSKSQTLSIQKIKAAMEIFLQWNQSTHGYFMVEEYIPNIPVPHQSKKYDATMRVALLFLRDNHQMRCEPFACYWKLPPQPIDFTGELREKTLSSFNKTRHDAAPVCKEHQEQVYSQLKIMLPKILQAMIKKDIPGEIEKEEECTDTQKFYKTNSWMHFSNALAYRGEYELSAYYLNKAQALVSDNFFGIHHQKGVLLHLQSKYREAIESYDKALQLNPYNMASYNRRAHAFKALNEIVNSRKDVDKKIIGNLSYLHEIPKLTSHINLISQQELEERIDKIQRSFLTSNNILSRVKYPYYEHISVPNSLQIFKKRLYIYRQQSAELVAKQPDLLLPNASHDMRNLSIGTFGHKFCVSLVVSRLKIGDCGECSTKLGLDLIQAGFGNLAFVEVEFLNAKEGMENYHSFIVANLPTLPNAKNTALTVYEFFKALPTNAIIADTFLGLAFSPTTVPAEFNEYINVYGGKTTIIQCRHFYNVPYDSMVFGSYLTLAKKIAKEIKSKQQLLEEDPYLLARKTPIDDTTLICLLKTRTGFPFFGVRDETYKVDAITKVSTKKERADIKCLQRHLHGHGRFFHNNLREKMFVLEGINLSEENPKLIQDIQAIPFTCKP